MFKIEHNLLTGEIIKTPLNEQELKEVEKVEAESKAIQATRAAAEAAKAAEKTALLARLGITADEAKLLLG
jgi:hypothetical protein